MRHLVHFILIMVSAASARAGAPDLNAANDNEKYTVAAPVLIRSDKADESHVGVVTAEATPQRPDALSIFRQELNRQAAEEQAKAQKEGVFISTTKRFAPESITFFIAIGAVTFNSMWIKSHGDPLALERHINSLKDPIAHLSFYAFMQTQGFYMDFRTKRLGLSAMDESTRKQMMRRLSYQGMAIGSLASSLVADLGQSAKMCVNKWLKGKTDEQSLASCNEAWKQWTVRNKFTQYFPQIISMWISQAATEVIEKGATRAFDKVATTAFFRSMLSKKFLVNMAYKVTATDVVLTFAGGGWVTKTIKVVGKVTRFGLFVGVDQLLSRYTYRPVNNLIQPALFDFDVMHMNDSFKESDAGNWDAGHMTDPKSLTRFEDRVERFGQHLQQWRDHLNQDAEGDLAGWMEMTKKILNQIDYTYKYYKGFSNTFFESLYVGNLIHNKELDPAARNVISRYPFRTLPLYGVSVGPYKPVGGQRLSDLYMLSPGEMQMRQKEHALAVANAFKNRANALDIKKLEKDEYNNNIIGKILTGDENKMAAGINNMNMTLDIHQAQIQTESGYSNDSGEYIDLLSALRTALGDAHPVVYPFAGYSQAFAEFSTAQVTAESADFGKWSIPGKYKFNKEADLMFYNMICGQNISQLYRLELVGVDFSFPQFIPPSLLKPSVSKADRDSFCSGIITTENLYSKKIGNQDLYHYLLHNINYAAIGDFTGKEENAQAFERWWLNAAKKPLMVKFKEFDQKYKVVYREAFDNFFNNRSVYKKIVDILNQSRYLQQDMKSTLKFESNFYLQILSRTLQDGTIAAPVEQRPLSWFWDKITFSPYNYVDFARQNSVTDFKSMYKTVPAEVANLNNLLNAYYGFINNPGVSFDQYIEHSKKIDTAINDVLVKARIKKVTLVTTAGPDEEEDLSAPASSSGTEVTSKVYEDLPHPRGYTYKQRMTLASVRGLRLVEAEVRRFIRMRVMLSQSLALDTEEFMADWNNANPPVSTRPRAANPFGGLN
jgi:hypothetical protein